MRQSTSMCEGVGGRRSHYPRRRNRSEIDQHHQRCLQQIQLLAWAVVIRIPATPTRVNVHDATRVPDISSHGLSWGTRVRVAA